MIAKVLIIAFALQTGGDAVSGPLTDAIERRLDKIAERMESNNGLFDRLYERLEESHGRRLKEIVGGMQLAKLERQTLLSEFRKWNDEREGLLARISAATEAAMEAREEARQANKEAREARREALAAWTPFQNLAKRGLWLVWYLFLLIVAALALWEFVKWAWARVFGGLFSFSKVKIMKSISALIVAVFVACVAVAASAQDCPTCREVNSFRVVKTPTLAPALPSVREVVAVPVRVAAVPIRVVSQVPQVVRQMPVVRHVGHGHVVSVLERPVGVIRRAVRVPQVLLHRLRFGCR